MDTFLTIASKRDQREYASESLPEQALQRVLEAGRLSGNAMNRQQRRFVVLSAESCRRAAPFVTRPGNLEGCVVAIGIISRPGTWAGFDAGRAAQSMMLTAWAEGVGSCPNAIADATGLAGVLGAREEEEEAVTVVLSFGYPPSHLKPDSRPLEQWLSGADRESLNELVTRI